MPRITEDLVRRRAEHNDCEIATLEELSLHQQDLERIEHLDRWCKGLKILYLQNNVIPKIENVGRLKQLQYLNLALNNIETVENLEGCEFLEKLDLTVNFVGNLQSVESLQCNVHLREMYLTGNPCTDYEGYREFVVATLPQLERLDGREISKSERILALQRYEEVKEKILKQQKLHERKREKEKREHAAKSTHRGQPGFDGRWYTDPEAHVKKDANGVGETNQTNSSKRAENEEEGEEERFWNESVPYTPESRAETHAFMAEKMKEKAKEPSGPNPIKRVLRLERDGKMLNINEGRYDFDFEDDDEHNRYVLEIACPRFMDTSLIDCDIQPTYVRITMKGKVFQLVLQEEVSPDGSSVQRSKTTGRLLVTLPKAKPVLRAKHRTTPTSHVATPTSCVTKPGLATQQREDVKKQKSRETLEVDPTLSNTPDIAAIVSEDGREPSATRSHRPAASGVPNRPLVEEMSDQQKCSDFIDDPDVPPLI